VNLEDEPRPLEIHEGQLSTTDAGFPRAVAEIAEVAAVFLSGRCSTCLAVADAFRTGSPEAVWFVVADDKSAETQRLVESLRASEPRIIVDSDQRLARVSAHVTPAVFIFSFGQLEAAYLVSSPRQVIALVPKSAVEAQSPDVLTTSVPVG
jgi:hypothetical protein